MTPNMVTLMRRIRSSWPFAVGAAAAIIGMSLSPATHHRVGPADIIMRAEPGWGRTVLQVPPFGSLSGQTHKAPIEISMVLTEVDAHALAGLIENSRSAEEFVEDLQDGLERAALSGSIRLIIVGVLLGGIVLGLLPGRRRATIVAGAVGGLLGVGLVLGLTATTFDFAAFEEPRYTGALERAPAIIAAVQREAGSFKKIPSRFKVAAASLSNLLALVSEPVSNPSNQSEAILHISDIHSNPLGLQITKQLAAQFQVSAIIDTGDLTSFAEPIEAQIAEIISSFPVPYLFVPGNHDSLANRDALAAIRNVTLLAGDRVTEIAGVRIMGWPDPTFNSAGKLSAAESSKAQIKEASRVATAVELLAPDVLAVHHPDLAKASLGKVPLVLAGHGHLRRMEKTNQTMVLQVGSTGATGLGSFLVDADHAYEAEILYFRDGKVIAVDYVRFRGLGRDFDLERTVLDSKDAIPVH